MCKRVIATGFALVLLALLIAPASAQTGYVAVYFNEGMSIEQKNCQGVGVFDTLTIGMVNWNMFISGVQFRVLYPAQMVHVADFNFPPVTQGSTPAGFATGFGLPQNGFSRVFVTNVLVIWTCDVCTSTNVPVPVVGHPLLGNTVTATQWPANNKVNGIGLTALLCATVPTEETTWGKVKSLYSE
jgi:hypothetical protein